MCSCTPFFDLRWGPHSNSSKARAPAPTPGGGHGCACAMAVCGQDTVPVHRQVQDAASLHPFVPGHGRGGAERPGTLKSPRWGAAPQRARACRACDGACDSNCGPVVAVRPGACCWLGCLARVLVRSADSRGAAGGASASRSRGARIRPKFSRVGSTWAAQHRPTIGTCSR